MYYYIKGGFTVQKGNVCRKFQVFIFPSRILQLIVHIKANLYLLSVWCTLINGYEASGPDELAPRILKELHEEIAPAVTFLFQKSLNLGQTPIDWKHAYVCPIFKKGVRHEPANYRPVSLTCILCKLMEHIIVSNVMKHLENNKVLTKFQHGFRSKRSCETQLIGLIQDLTSTMDSKM